MIQANRSRQAAETDALMGAAVHTIRGASLAGSATIPTSTTAAGAHCVMLAIMLVEMSGIFDVNITTACTGITTGDSVDYSVTTDHASAAPVVTSGVAFGSAPTGDKATVASVMYTNHGTAGGITYTNGLVGAPGNTMMDTGAQVAVTTALNQMFTFSGAVGASITAGTGALVPFTVGQLAIIGLYTNVSAGAMTWQALNVEITERLA